MQSTDRAIPCHALKAKQWAYPLAQENQHHKLNPITAFWE